MVSHDPQIGKIERHVIEVRDRPSGFGWCKRTRMPNLEAEWDIEFDAFRIKRVIAAIVRRQIPQPWQNPKPAKSELTDGAAQFTNGIHWSGEIDRRDPEQAVGILTDKRSNLIVIDQRPTRSPPRADQSEPNAGCFHGVNGRRERNADRWRELCARNPASERLEHRLRAKAGGWMLHPHVNDGAMQL